MTKIGGELKEVDELGEAYGIIRSAAIMDNMPSNTPWKMLLVLRDLDKRLTALEVRQREKGVYYRDDDKEG